MHKSQLLGKHSAESNYGPKTTSSVINNNLNDYFVKSNNSKVLQTALYQQNYVAFRIPKEEEGGFRPPNLPGCATGSNHSIKLFFFLSLIFEKR